MSGSDSDVVIVSLARTPMGSFGGVLSDIPAPALGSIALRAAIERVGGKLKVGDIDTVIMGHVLTSGCGQSTARQAAIGAGVPIYVPSYSVDKVCASGMKALTIAATSISSGAETVCLVGGMESMSRVPYQLDSFRSGKRMGHDQITDGLIRDGLWDVYDDEHMGTCTEKVNEKYQISRADMDAWALESNKRAKEAYKAGLFASEIVPVTTPKGVQVSVDEQLDRVKPEKLANLKPSFKPDGVITPGNASPVSDGAAAMLLMSRSAAVSRGIKPLARVVKWADAAREPVEFTVAPALAIAKVLRLAGLAVKDIGVWELNEAFATVVLANAKILSDINLGDVNILGGALSLGHPLGCSGARIVCTLITAMRHRGARYGCAAICNGGGQASAVIIELEQ